MKEWLNEHGAKISYFVAGWCAFACLDCLAKGNYTLAAINGFLVFFNFKLASR